jgi:hypothetical protein
MDKLIPHDNRLEQPMGTDFKPEEGFLVVRIDLEGYGLPSYDVRYQGKGFRPKDEMHITIVSRQAAETVQAHLERQPGDLKRMEDLIHDTDWSYRKLDRFYYVIEEPGQETIIQMVEVPSLEEFYQRLGEILGRSLDVPPSHVTLFTHGTSKGIGLPTRQVFDELVKAQVKPDEVSQVDEAER